MIKQQISPWTIYDQNGKKVDIPSTNPKNIAVFPNSERLTRRDGHEKYTKLNDLLCQLASQKLKLHDKINFLTSLKIISSQLHQETNPINQIRILPQIKNENVFETEKRRKSKSHRHYYSQKLSLLHEAEKQALTDFSKIFISKSLQDKPQPVVKPQFPKINKQKSVLLADLDRKQFEDNSIHETIEMAKKNYYKRVSAASLPLDFSS